MGCKVIVQSALANEKQLPLVERSVAFCGLGSGWPGGTVPLSLNTRAVGEVTIIQCRGRIVPGGEAESLREHVCGLFQDHRNIVLHLSEVVFIDSSGMGTVGAAADQHTQGQWRLEIMQRAARHLQSA